MTPNPLLDTVTFPLIKVATAEINFPSVLQGYKVFQIKCSSRPVAQSELQSLVTYSIAKSME